MSKKTILTLVVASFLTEAAAAQDDTTSDRSDRARAIEAIEARSRAMGRQPPDREVIERMLDARAGTTQRRASDRQAIERMLRDRTGTSAGRSAREPDAEKRQPTGQPDRRRPQRSQARRISQPLVVLLDEDRFLKRKRSVYRVKHLPASDLAQTIMRLLATEASHATRAETKVPSVTLVPDPVTNSVVVGAVPEALGGVLDLLEELDRRPKMVSIEVLVAEVSADVTDDTQDADSVSVSDQSISQLALELNKRPGLRTLARPQLAVLDGQSASLRLGRQAGRITGVRPTGQGGWTNSYTFEKVLFTMGITVRINPDGLVTMEIDLDQTDLGPAEQGVPVAVPNDGEPTYRPTVQTLKTQTAVCLANGQTAALGQMGTRQDTGPTKLILFVSPRIQTTSAK